MAIIQKTLITSLSLSLLVIQSFASNKNEICTAQFPNKKLIEVYALKKIYNDLNRLHKTLLKSPLESESEVKDVLRSEYENFLKETTTIEQRNQVFLDQPEYLQNKLLTILNEYLTEVKAAKEQAAFDVLNLEIPHSLHPLKVEEILKIKKLELLKIYKPRMQTALDEAKTISRKGRAFLIKWTLEYLPNQPTYYWGSHAEKLHRFMWDTIHAEKLISPTGRFAFGSFWVETNVISTTPGLNLNIAPRMTDHTKNMNIRFRLSPFSEQIETYACDFSENPNGCTLQTLDEWCGIKPTFLQRFLGLNH